MPKYAMLDFDPLDKEDQYAIAYNDHSDSSGDTNVEWFDTEELRAKQVEKDLKNGIVFLNKWEKENA
jgi:hypothetical protein